MYHKEKDKYQRCLKIKSLCTALSKVFNIFIATTKNSPKCLKAKDQVKDQKERKEDRLFNIFFNNYTGNSEKRFEELRFFFKTILFRIDSKDFRKIKVESTGRQLKDWVRIPLFGFSWMETCFKQKGKIKVDRQVREFNKAECKFRSTRFENQWMNTIKTYVLYNFKMEN